MLELESTECCGVRIMSGLRSNMNTKKALLRICEEMYIHDTDGAFIIFSGASDSFINYIRRNKLGGIRATKIKNPSGAGRPMRAWIWEVNNVNTKTWFNKYSSHNVRITNRDS